MLLFATFRSLQNYVPKNNFLFLRLNGIFVVRRTVHIGTLKREKCQNVLCQKNIILSDKKVSFYISCLSQLFVRGMPNAFCAVHLFYTSNMFKDIL